MIKPKRVAKKKKIIDALYIHFKDLPNLPSNACLQVDCNYLYRIIDRARQKNIEDNYFWSIINKYKKYEQYKYELNRQYNYYIRYQLMSLRDILYLIHITDYKPYSISTFVKTNITENELETKIKQINEEYEQENKVIKSKIKIPENL